MNLQPRTASNSERHDGDLRSPEPWANIFHGSGHVDAGVRIGQPANFFRRFAADNSKRCVWATFNYQRKNVRCKVQDSVYIRSPAHHARKYEIARVRTRASPVMLDINSGWN